MPIGWLDIDDIVEALRERHPEVDPIALRFTDLKKYILGLPDFREDPRHPANERILETIQARWIEENNDAPRDD